MRYIKKYESVSSEVSDLYDIVKLCFAEFLDKNIADVEDLVYDNGTKIYYSDGVNLTVNLPEMDDDFQSPTSIESFIDTTEEYLDVLKDIKVAIERVKDEYPNIIVSVGKDYDVINEKKVSYLSIAFDFK